MSDQPKYRSRTPPKGKKSKSKSSRTTIAEVSPDIAGGSSGAGGDTMRGSAPAGSHRSYVARRFLEDEGDDLDMEPEAVDLMGEDSEAGGHRAGGAGGNIFDRRDNRAVDQSVNLMDMGAGGGYEKKSRRSRPRGLQRGTKQGTSMVDVFLDYATSDSSPGQRGRVGDLSKSRKSKCKTLVSSTRFLIVMVGIVVAILIVVFAVVGGNKGEDKPKPAASNAKEGDGSRLGLIQKKVAASGATSLEDLTDSNAYSFKAAQWLAEADEAQINPDDPGLIQRYVAAVLYLSTQPGDRPDPLFGSWLKEDKWMSKADVCSWFGIECEDIMSRNVIVHCNLTTNQLQGAIPSELKALNYLTELDLSGNRLSGAMPDDIGELTSLKYLMLQENHLTGSLPKSINAMTSLEEIFLSRNKFEGHLTEMIGLLENLRGIRVDHNLLTGALPNDWKQKGITVLHLNNNEFKGHIPHQLFQLTTLVDFRLGNNYLTGTIPPEIESIYRLEIFEAQMNRLHGSIPEVFDRLDHLKEINLHHNSFEGALPRTLGKAAVLESVLFDSNFLTGSVPEEWAEATALHSLVLHTNKLTGKIPPQVESMALLRQLWLNNNLITGEIPSQLGSLRDLSTLHLENTKITGQVPAELENLKVLATLRVFNTSVTGTMPSGVCDLKDQNQLEKLEANCNDAMKCECCTTCH